MPVVFLNSGGNFSVTNNQMNVYDNERLQNPLGERSELTWRFLDCGSLKDYRNLANLFTNDDLGTRIQ